MILLARNTQLLLDWTYHARTGFRRCGTSLPQLSSGPLGGEIFVETMKRITEADHMTHKDIDDYIASFSPEIQTILKKIRAIIRKAAPDAKEKISYRIPTFTLEGNLVHFAAFKNHIGFYPPVRGNDTLRKQIAIFAGEKGNLKFPLDKPIPYDLISKIVKIRVRENLKRANARTKKK
jgi:uncharacterized protein YdhG (YjbR/CyaY superfamily)